MTKAKTREVQEHQIRTTELQSIVEDNDRQFQAKNRLLQENQAVIQAKDRQGVSNMTWRNGKSAPTAKIRGAAVVHGNTAYITTGGSRISTHTRTF